MKSYKFVYPNGKVTVMDCKHDNEADAWMIVSKAESWVRLTDVMAARPETLAIEPVAELDPPEPGVIDMRQRAV